MPEFACPSTAPSSLSYDAAAADIGATTPPSELAPIPCANCRAPLATPYCGRCGAPGLEHRPLTVRRVAGDLWTELTSVDSGTVRTLRTLLLEPGRLTRDYLDGRTRHYLSPLRVFLIGVTALVFIGSVSGYQQQTEERVRASVAAKQQAARAKQSAVAAVPVKRATPTKAHDEHWLRRRAIMRRFTPEALSQTLVGAISAVSTNQWLQIVNPLAVALALAAVMRRKRRSYAEHFVFALHFMAFSSLLSAAIIPLRLVSDDPPSFFNIFSLLYWIVAARYFYLAARRVYASSVRRTVVDTALFAVTAQSAMFVLPFTVITGMMLWAILTLGVRLLMA